MDREIHAGVSILRQYCTTNLKQLNDNRQILILHDRAQPISVMISYDLYIKWQEVIKKLTKERML